MSFAGDLAAILQGGLAVDAVYTPVGGGSPVAIRVIPSQPDLTASFGQSQITSATTRFTCAVADVPDPQRGDLFTVEGQTYRLQGAPQRDPRRLRWLIEAVPT